MADLLLISAILIAFLVIFVIGRLLERPGDGIGTAPPWPIPHPDRVTKLKESRDA